MNNKNKKGWFQIASKHLGEMLQQLIGDLIRTWRLVVAQTACPYAGSSCGILPQCHLSTKASWSAGPVCLPHYCSLLLDRSAGSQHVRSVYHLCFSRCIFQ
ncbi:hypothetical protein WJX77_006339 [Trebouxia sp. C0004]